LVLGPGEYRTGALKLPAGTQLIGVRGATRLTFAGGPSMISARGADHITLSGLVLDGISRPLPEGGALLQIAQSKHFRMTDCDVRRSSRNGIALEAVEGALSGNIVTGAAEAAIFSRDAAGLTIQNNIIRDIGNNGVLVWRTAKGDDGTLVIDNRIEDIAARRGGSGQYGNAVNVFRAANVIVRGNRIRNCAFTAVRGNAASNFQIANNSISDVREVAIYAEFGFEGALVANNTIDGAAIGVSITNFNQGGRLATVHGNIIRNLLPKRPAGTDPGDGAGIGIAVEADSAVTGNVIENAPTAGMILGWGQHLRDVAATGNVVRTADIGIGVSVSTGAGAALIANNMIADVKRGAIVGMDRKRIVTGDLMRGGAERYANLTVSGNRVR
jgi:uncharacterized secreted repeat protein (TIGR03808 family)